MEDNSKETPHIKIIFDETISIKVTQKEMIKAMVEESENSMILPEPPNNEKLN